MALLVCDHERHQRGIAWRELLKKPQTIENIAGHIQGHLDRFLFVGLLANGQGGNVQAGRAAINRVMQLESSTCPYLGAKCALLEETHETTEPCHRVADFDLQLIDGLFRSLSFPAAILADIFKERHFLGFTLVRYEI